MKGALGISCSPEISESVSQFHQTLLMDSKGWVVVSLTANTASQVEEAEGTGESFTHRDPTPMHGAVKRATFDLGQQMLRSAKNELRHSRCSRAEAKDVQDNRCSVFRVSQDAWFRLVCAPHKECRVWCVGTREPLGHKRERREKGGGF